jgi:5-methylcytosine-specific restriction endonuclease McrA
MDIVSCVQGPQILTLDIAGRPASWIGWDEAAVLYCRERIAWEAGESRIRVRGGHSRVTGRRTELLLSSIVAVTRHASGRALPRLVPPLTNRALFRRDQNLCLYCGRRHAVSALTRDHVVPRACGGTDAWKNVATACGPCNRRKGARTPEQARMPLLAVPYAPDMAEWLVLSNRRILADQMRFLQMG